MPKGQKKGSSQPAKFESRPEFKKLLRRVKSQHPGVSEKKAKEEAKRRLHDREANPPEPRRQRVPRDVVPRSPAPSRLPQLANQRASRPSVSISDASLLAKLNAHLPFKLPPFSAGGVVTSATLVRGESLATFTLAPGEKLSIFGDPWSTGFGWACTHSAGLGWQGYGEGLCNNDTTDNSAAKINAWGSVTYNNPSYLPATLEGQTVPDTSVRWTLIPFTQDPFNNPGITASDLIQWPNNTAYGGVWDPFALNAAYISPQRGSLHATVTSSWDAVGMSYELGANTQPIIFGPGSGYTVLNDGNASDSAIVCANPLFLAGNAAPQNNPFLGLDGVDAALAAYVEPIPIVGATAPNHFHIQCYQPSSDCWQKMGSSKAAAPIAANVSPSQNTSNANALVHDQNGMSSSYFNDTTLSAPPMAYFVSQYNREDEADLTYQPAANSQPNVQEQLTQFNKRFGQQLKAIFMRADSFFRVQNDGTSGSMTVVIRASRDYGMVQQPRGPLARFNRPIFTYKDPIPKTIPGHAGHSRTTEAAARVNAIVKAQTAASDAGFVSKVWNTAKQLASNSAVRSGAISGLIEMADVGAMGIANITPAGPAVDAVALLGPVINGALRKVPFIKHAENAIVNGVEGLGRDIWGGLKSIF